MARKTTSPRPTLRRALKALGERLRLARLRRSLTAQQVADRAGMSRTTLRAIEQGAPGVTLGAWLNVLHVLGLESDLDQLAQDDELGRRLQDVELRKRAQTTKAART